MKLKALTNEIKINIFSVEHKKNDNWTLNYLLWKEYNSQRGFLRLSLFSSGKENQEMMQYRKRMWQISLNKHAEGT